MVKEKKKADVFASGKWLRCKADRSPQESKWRQVSQPCSTRALRKHVRKGGLVGLVPGSLGLVVIDIDSKPCKANKTNPDRVFAKLRKVLGEPACYYKTSGKGGIHVVYEYRGKWKGGQMRWKFGDIVGGDGAYFAVWDLAAFEARGKAVITKANLESLPKPKTSQGTWRSGNRNNEFNQAVFEAVISSREDKIKALTEKARRSGLTEREIKATLKSAHKAAKKTLKHHDGKPILRLNEDGLASTLKFCDISVRYNLRSGMPEWRQTGKTWYDLTDRAEAAIRRRIAASCLSMGRNPQGKNKPWRLPDNHWRNYLNALLFNNEIDALVTDYLDDLTPAPSKLLDTWLHAIFEFDSPDKLVEAVARGILIGIVERTFEPGYQIRDWPLFVGPPKVGKSIMVRYLVPRANLFGDELDFHTNNQKQLEAIQGKAVVEIAELQGITERSAQKVKSYITRQVDNGIRKAFRRNPENEPRRVFFIGTANPDAAILPMDAGLLDRFVLLEITKENGRLGHVKKWLNRHRDELFSAALHEYEAGERYTTLPKALKTISSEVLQEYVEDPDQELRENILNILRNQTDKKGFIASAKLLDRLAIFEEDQRKVPKILRSVGCRPMRKTIRKKGKRLDERGWNCTRFLEGDAADAT